MKDSQFDQFKKTIADRYGLLHEVGRGARASVFLAHDKKHDRKVALKVLLPEFASSVSAARFLKEIGIAAKMVHPHILPLYDSGEADGTLFYVMPYVEGKTLRELIQENGPLSIPQAVQLTRQVADALAFAHRRGVVHRDIKPENILLEDGKAVVADFGIARALATSTEGTLTAAGVAIGTPQYMSPEQSSGDQKVDGRTDIYSLGCVLYEMLTGHTPFSGSRAAEILAKQIHKPAKSPLSERKGVPIWLDRLVLRMLAKDPEKRFDTAESLAAEIGRQTGPEFLLVGHPIVRWTYRVQRRYRPLLLGASGIALAGFLLNQTLGPPSPPLEGGFPATNLAVLPFLDLSESEGTEQLAMAFTGLLTRHLGDLAPLTVVSDATMREHRRVSVQVDSIVRRHQIGTLVEGTLMATDEEIWVSIALTDGASGAQLGTIKPLSRPREESPQLLSEMADEVARLLRRLLGVEFERRALEAGTDCGHCLEMYFLAGGMRDQVRQMVDDGNTSEARRLLTDSDSILRSLLEMDPNWDAPLLGLAWTELFQARLFSPDLTSFDSASLDRGLGYAEEVLSADPANSEALEVQGILQSYAGRNTQDSAEKDRLFAAARQNLERAVLGDPHLGAAWSALSYLHWQAGRFPEAKQAAEYALDADAWMFNDETIIMRLCQITLDLEEIDEANYWCIDEGRKRFPQRSGFVSFELLLYASWAGREPDIDRAWALADTLVQLFPPHRRAAARPQALMDVAAVVARSGLADSARAVIQQARAVSPTEDPALSYREANVRLQLGETEEALSLLRQYLTERPDRRAYVSRDWWFRPLFDHPDFRRLVGSDPQL